MGCMTTQMIHEAGVAWDGKPKGRAPKANKMERGSEDDETKHTSKDDDDDDFVEISDMKMPWEKKLKATNANANASAPPGGRP